MHSDFSLNNNTNENIWLYANPPPAQGFCLLSFVWCTCAAINVVSVQYSGGFLPGILPILVFLYSIFSFRVWSDGLYFLLGDFPTLTCFLFFLNLLFLETCTIFFSQVLGLSLGLFILSLYYFSVIFFGLACDHGNSFLCLEE